MKTRAPKAYYEHGSSCAEGVLRAELAAKVQYGAGLRLSELVRLRVKDIDLQRATLTVRQGKGDKDRVTVLAKSLRDEVAEQLGNARALWQRDRETEWAGTYLPPAMARKHRRAAKEFPWSCKRLRLTRSPRKGLRPTRFPYKRMCLTRVPCKRLRLTRSACQGLGHTRIVKEQGHVTEGFTWSPRPRFTSTSRWERMVSG